jgi:OCT family organic cation transporter-like MFS transporter 4/5
MERGRKICLVVSLVAATIACLGASVSEYYSMVAQSICLGLMRFGLAAAFDVVFTLTSELFPTVVRSSAFGACSTLSRISSMMAPAIVEVGMEMQLQPLVGITLVLIVNSICSLKIPETLNRDLPDYIEEEKYELNESIRQSEEAQSAQNESEN